MNEGRKEGMSKVKCESQSDLPEGEPKAAVHRVGRELQSLLPDVQLLLAGGVLRGRPNG